MSSLQAAPHPGNPGRAPVRTLPPSWFDSRGELKFVKATPDLISDRDLTDRQFRILMAIRFHDWGPDGGRPTTAEVAELSAQETTGPDRGAGSMRREFRELKRKGFMTTEAVKRTRKTACTRLIVLAPQPAARPDEPRLYREPTRARSTDAPRAPAPGQTTVRPGAVDRSRPGAGALHLDPFGKTDEERQTTDSSRGDDPLGGVDPSSSSSREVSRGEGGGVPEASRPAGPPADDDRGDGQDDGQGGPPDPPDEGPARARLFEAIDRAIPDPERNRAARRWALAQVEAIRGESPTPEDHVRRAIEIAAAARLKPGKTIRDHASGVLRNWRGPEGFPPPESAVPAPSRPAPDPEADRLAAEERRRAALQAARRQDEERARWEGLAGPERAAVDAEVSRANPYLAALSEKSRELAAAICRRELLATLSDDQLAELVAAAGPPPAAVEAPPPPPPPAVEARPARAPGVVRAEPPDVVRARLLAQLEARPRAAVPAAPEPVAPIPPPDPGPPPPDPSRPGLIGRLAAKMAGAFVLFGIGGVP